MEDDINNEYSDKWTIQPENIVNLAPNDAECIIFICNNQDGLNYDLKTIVNPRRNAVTVQPSIDLVRKSIYIFE